MGSVNICSIAPFSVYIDTMTDFNDSNNSYNNFAQKLNVQSIKH